jgi:hypothetical protein
MREAQVAAEVTEPLREVVGLAAAARGAVRQLTLLELLERQIPAARVAVEQPVDLQEA